MAPDNDDGSGSGFTGLSESPYDTGDHRGWGSWLVLGVGVILAVAAVGFFVFMNGSSDPVAQPIGTSSPDTVTLSSMTTTVAAPVVLVTDPEVVSGAFGPHPNTVPSVPEVPLVPLDGLTLPDRELLDGRGHLAPDVRIGVGEIAGTSFRVFVVTGTGIFENAPDEGQPSVCYSLSGYPHPASAVTDCARLESPPALVALWTGIEKDGLYAWAGLPPGAAVAVLSMDGQPVMWQRSVSGVVAFESDDSGDLVEVVALDAAGNELGRSDRTPAIPDPTGPITGYGDYSGIPAESLDMGAVMAAVARCMTGYGYDTLSTPDGGIFPLRIPGDWVRVWAVQEACWAGLGLPILSGDS